MPFTLHRLARLALIAVAVCACLVALPAAASRAGAVTRSVDRATPPPKVPPGFVGVNMDQALIAGGVALPPAFQTMVGAGVESVRVAFSWAAAQPVQNGPYDFSATDQIVGDAAQAGITVLPTVIYTPAWDARPNPPGTLPVPRDDAPYGAYLSALVARYGPNGTFWATNPSLPKRPIHEWQIWNEPNLPFFWPPRPFARGYVALLKVAHAAIKRADPTAKVVLAGMPNHAWVSLANIYKVPGASRYFDVVAVHPYTPQVSNVIRFLRLMRGVMKRNGDASKPLLISEMGWNSTSGHHPSDNYCCQVSAAQQAARVAKVLPLLAKDRKALKLQAFYYYTWASAGSDGSPSDTWAGIFEIKGPRLIPKPVFSRFKAGVLAIEHCRRIGRLAGTCAAPVR